MENKHLHFSQNAVSTNKKTNNNEGNNSEDEMDWFDMKAVPKVHKQDVQIKTPELDLKLDKRNSENVFTYKKLLDIYNMESQEMKSFFLNNFSKFEEFCKSQILNDQIYLSFKIINKISQSYDAHEIGDVLEVFLSDEFVHNILIYLDNITNEKEKNKNFWADPQTFFDNLQVYCSLIPKLKPHLSGALLPKLINNSLKTIRYISMSENVVISTNIEALQEKLNRSEEEKKLRILKYQKVVKDYREPPDSFRYMEIYPTIEDLKSSEKPFLNKLLISGAYLDLEHYLDTHFRLLRYDYVKPLNQNILETIKTLKNTTKVYKKVQFIKTFIKNYKIYHLLQLQHHHMIDFNANFKYGSLLVLTSDNFNSIHLGTVGENMEENYIKKQIIVEFLNLKIHKNNVYTLIESQVYFPAYRYILKDLQLIKKIPFEEILLEGRNTKTLPGYFLNKTNFEPFNFKCNNHILKIHPNLTFPSSTDLNLDEYQLEAFRNCIFSNFSLIQGPPGTGKTYLLLKILDFLLQNSNVWNTGPLLVVTYTNQAIDQLLAGVLNFTQDVVRLGTQGDIKFNKYNLNTLRDRSETPVTRKLLKALNKIQYIVNKREFYADLSNILPFNVIQEIFNNWNIENISKWLLNDKTQSLHDYPKVETFNTAPESQHFEVSFKVSPSDQKIQQRLDERRNNKIKLNPSLLNTKDFQILNFDDRWNLYWQMHEKFLKTLNTNLTELQAEYEVLYQQHEDIRSTEDAQIVSKCKVVAMTTTGAAKYKKILELVKPPIVIIEEAAQILEAHVVVALTKHCQQIILIGDHKQLRPTTAVYDSGKLYNLDISLFERLINNKFDFKTLKIQHRMRPEISKLISPAIYDKLENHKKVTCLPGVKGVKKNVYFINHSVDEEELNSCTKKNTHEALFLLHLALYLLKQGYQETDITILTTYNGQLECLLQERNRFTMLKKVRMTVVDNFQGEENKIILLSLVRSNKEANIGFLKTENRVCVALSRAQQGLYMIGNMSNLTRNNEIWPKINKTLIENKCIGTCLELQCQIHRHQQTLVRRAEDFGAVSGGGCSLDCQTMLICGHICPNKCHVENVEHRDYVCVKCLKTGEQI